jgi:hypothetical protein
MFSRILPNLRRVPLKLILKRHWEIISQNVSQKHLDGRAPRSWIPNDSAERPRSSPGRSSRVVRVLLGNLPEIGDSNGAPGREFLSVALDPIQLVESDCCQVAFSTVRTGNHWHPLDHEQVAATAITPRYATLPGSLFTANLADFRISNCHG